MRDALPPRLSDRVLMDLEALTAWEAHVVDALAGRRRRGPDAVEDVLARLAAAGRSISRAWTPGGRRSSTPSRGLATGRPVVRARAASRAVDARARAMRSAARRLPRAVDVAGAADESRRARRALRRADVAVRGAGRAPVSRRQGVRRVGDAIRPMPRARSSSWLALALTVLRVECARACADDQRPLDRERLVTAVRQADLLLVHYADSAALADALTRA